MVASCFFAGTDFGVLLLAVRRVRGVAAAVLLLSDTAKSTLGLLLRVLRRRGVGTTVVSSLGATAALG